MHREIQIKQFPIVTTHWWPKTRNERFVWENQQYLYRFLPLVHNHVQVIWVPHTSGVWRVCVCDVCVRALWLTLHSHGASASTLDGGRVWSVVLTRRHRLTLVLHEWDWVFEILGTGSDWLTPPLALEKLRQHHASDTPSISARTHTKLKILDALGVSW